MLQKIQYINEYTGEVRSGGIKKLPDVFDRERGYQFWVRKNASRLFAEVPFPEELNDMELGRMLRLAKKIWSNTNMLGYRGNGGARPYGIMQIAVILNLGFRQTQRFIDKMIRLGLLARVTIKIEDRREIQYYVNPIYFCSSSRISLNLYLIFRKQLDAFLPEWVKEEFSKQVK